MNHEGEPSSESSNDATSVPESSRPKRKPNLGARKDKQRVHATRHAILSQFPMQALALLGENTRRLRRIEHALRVGLKPSGILADILFDRMFSSYLRCLLAARAEESTLAPAKRHGDALAQTPNLVDAELPTLIFETSENADGNFPRDLFRQLLLVQRYDGHFSREMFRCLGLLLILRNGGETGLEQCVEKMLGVKRDQ
jgi:hypothetical protein